MPERSTTHYDADIATIVAMRQRAHREVNAFPTNTPLNFEEQHEIINTLPELGVPDAIKRRLGAAAVYDMNSLDLARTDNLGDWEEGRAVDESVEVFFSELYASEALQRELGVVALSGYIPKESEKAKPESQATSLGEELDQLGIYHVVRMRRVAVLAVAYSGHPLVVRKRSDFRFGGVPGTPKDMAAKAMFVARGGWPAEYVVEHGLDPEKLQALFEEVRGNFNAGIETAIKERPDWLHPINMSHHVKRGSLQKD